MSQMTTTHRNHSATDHKWHQRQMFHPDWHLCDVCCPRWLKVLLPNKIHVIVINKIVQETLTLPFPYQCSNVNLDNIIKNVFALTFLRDRMIVEGISEKQPFYNNIVCDVNYQCPSSFTWSCSFWIILQKWLFKQLQITVFLFKTVSLTLT